MNSFFGSETLYLTSRFVYFLGVFDFIVALLSMFRSFVPEYCVPLLVGNAVFYKVAVLTLSSFLDSFLPLDFFS